MGVLPRHEPSATDVAPPPAWPVLASTFLIGIALVSLVDVFTDDPLEVALLDVPSELAGLPIVLVAPGREEVMGALEEPGLVTVRPGWEPLPALEWPYVLARPRGDDLPRLPEGYLVTGDWEVGQWQLAEIRPQAERATDDTLDLMTRLRHARVAFVHADGTETSCDRWRFGRWTCGLAEWLWVGPSEQLFRDRPRPCIWAHPRAGDTLTITFPEVSLGARLGGQFGFSDSAAAVPGGASVDFAVEVGDQIEQHTARNRRGLQAWQLTTRPGEVADVVFSVAADDDGRRHFCFTASVRGLGESGAGEESSGADSRPTLHGPLPTLVAPPRSVELPTRRLRLSSPGGQEGSGVGP